MEDEIPFYKRTLDSFADEIITKARLSNDGRSWYASLDVGPREWPSDPDFTRNAATEECARKLCASTIRADAKGVGKYAPHWPLRDCYDLRWRLMKHWAEKEMREPSAVAAGLHDREDIRDA